MEVDIYKDKDKIFSIRRYIIEKINDQIWEDESPENIQYIRSFKGKTENIEYMEFSDEDLNLIYLEKSGWLDKPSMFGEDISCRTVVEAVCYKVIQTAKEMLEKERSIYD